MIGWHIYTDPERDSSVEKRRHVMLAAKDRKAAKRLAKKILHHDPDKYICQPLTPAGETVTVMIPDYLPVELPDRSAFTTWYGS